MSQNGESSSNATRQTIPSAPSSEPTEEQRQTVDKCTNVVQDFRSGKITKPRASLLLQQLIPRDDSNENIFLSTYESYFDMLDNFEHYRSGNITSPIYGIRYFNPCEDIVGPLVGAIAGISRLHLGSWLL
jgi:hypothetical protein